MKSAILSLNLVAALLYGGVSLAAENMETQTQPPAAPSAAAPAPDITAPAPAPAPAPVAAAPQVQTAPIQKPESVTAHKTYDRKTILKLRQSKTLDLRYCLDRGSNAAIAMCAGE
jgi:hypothetical protein